jgi:hypothetical protein
MSEANPADAKQIKQLYDDGMKEVFKIVGSFDSTPEQLDAANDTAEALSAMLVKHTLATIDGRTALLAGLIVKLNLVIDAIETEPPYLDAVKGFTTIVGNAQKLFEKEVKNVA